MSKLFWCRQDECKPCCVPMIMYYLHPVMRHREIPLAVNFLRSFKLHRTIMVSSPCILASGTKSSWALLTHWGWDKMAIISQKTISNAFSWMKMLGFVPKGRINNIPSLVQIMAWRWPGDKPLSEPMMVRLPTHICVTRPQELSQLQFPFHFYECFRKKNVIKRFNYVLYKFY